MQDSRRFSRPIISSHRRVLIASNRSGGYSQPATPSELTATGVDAPGAPFREKRAGVDGAGFGITLDAKGDLWIGNFGFFGTTCPDNLLPTADSLSKLTANGIPLSPHTGFTQGCIRGPQGTVSDEQGSIWIANACGGTITKYRNGNPSDAWVFDIEAGN